MGPGRAARSAVEQSREGSLRLENDACAKSFRGMKIKKGSSAEPGKTRFVAHGAPVYAWPYERQLGSSS